MFCCVTYTDLLPHSMLIAYGQVIAALFSLTKSEAIAPCTPGRMCSYMQCDDGSGFMHGSFEMKFSSVTRCFAQSYDLRHKHIRHHRVRPAEYTMYVCG
jgi:hypothetical protein